MSTAKDDEQYVPVPVKEWEALQAENVWLRAELAEWEVPNGMNRTFAREEMGRLSSEIDRLRDERAGLRLNLLSARERVSQVEAQSERLRTGLKEVLRHLSFDSPEHRIVANALSRPDPAAAAAAYKAREPRDSSLIVGDHPRRDEPTTALDADSE